MGSPVLAPPDVKEVTLSLFGGRKTDISPSDLPEGLSPDTEDGIYLPGEWQSRPCLARLYAAGVLTAGTQVLYTKTYVQPNDDPLTLILTSDGKLWAEDVGNNPGNPSHIGTETAGLYAQSVTEFGREYIAFSDLLHGQGIPLQYDGTNLDRVTMDGPGTPPQVADYAVNYTIAASGVPGAEMLMNAVAITAYSEVGFVASVTISGAGFAGNIMVGDSIQVAGTGTGFDGTWTVSAVTSRPGSPGSTTISYVNTVSGLSPGSGGTISSQVAQFTTTAPNAFAVGNLVTIAGVGVAGYDGDWTIRTIVSNTVFIAAIGSFALGNSGGGTASLAGLVSPGAHQFCLMFLTRQGYITRPSPISVWIAAGNMEAHVTGIAIGPSNVVARIIAFTGAGGDNFFFLPTQVSLANPTSFPTVISSTVIPDNTSTSWTFNFSDNALFAGIAIDQIGNDLFDQVVLGPVLGFFAYASRLACWGDYNKVENFLNLGFCGGYFPTVEAPTGWQLGNLINGSGELVNGGPWAGGQSWQITGDGSNAQRGELYQSAYQDSFGDVLLSPLTNYSCRLWAQASATGLLGTFWVTITSASTSFSSTVSWAANTIPTAGAFLPLSAFSMEMPAVIPDDLVISFYTTNLTNLATITISELEVIFTDNPYHDNLSKWSYALNPEAFAQTTGELGPDDDESPIRCFALLKETSLLETAEGVHRFQDNDGEPGTWSVNQETRAIGALSLRAGDPGKFGTGDAAEDWAVVADRKGAYLFAGGEFWKISQEISRNPGTTQAQDPRKCWEDINFAAAQTIVTKNDPEARRVYFAVPLNGATTPNCIFVIDYREMDTASQIASAPPLHITITGKMRSSDLTRKSSVWNIATNDIEIIERPNNQLELVLAGGAFPGGQSYGNIYFLNPAKYTDDDYGKISPYYTTYAFTDHEQEAMLQLGAGNKLTKAVHAFITGIGQVIITPIVNSLYNFQPPLSPRILTQDTNQSNFLSSDLEWTTNIRGQRVFYRISVQPLPGTTDVQLKLQKFITWMMKDQVAQFRQSMV